MRDFYEGVWAGLPDDPEPWAWERRRALLLGELRPGERVLDLGCGAGRFVAALRDAGADAGRRRAGAGGAGAGAAQRPRSRPAAAGAGRQPAARSRRGRPRLVLGGARARPRHGRAADRGAPRAQARRPPARHRARPRPRQADADRARPPRRALRPARPARALLHAPLAGARARRDGLHGRAGSSRWAGRRCCAGRSSARALRG